MSFWIQWISLPVHCICFTRYCQHLASSFLRVIKRLTFVLIYSLMVSNMFVFVFAEAFNKSVVINVVINQEFNEMYEDKTSSKYKEFVGNFSLQVN